MSRALSTARIRLLSSPSRRAVFALAAAIAVSTALLAMPATSARAATYYCAPPTSRSFFGTIAGEDGRAVNATIGFDIQDRNGRLIDGITGCAAHGYGRLLEMNHYVGATGAPVGSRMVNGQPTSASWRIDHLPANATAVWVEVWARRWTGSACTTCAGDLTWQKYGWFNRRAVPISGRPVPLTLPLTPQYGGDTGNVQVLVRDRAGQPVTATSVYGWSELTPDGSQKYQGWGASVALGPGRYILPGLASRQSYAVWVEYRGVTYKRLQVPVYPRHSTPIVVTVS